MIFRNTRHRWTKKSFPLDRGDGLGREIVEDAVDALDFGQNPVRDFAEQRVGDLLNVVAEVASTLNPENDRPVQVRLLSLIPVDFRSGTTVKYCQTFP